MTDSRLPTAKDKLAAVLGQHTIGGTVCGGLDCVGGAISVGFLVSALVCAATAAETAGTVCLALAAASVASRNHSGAGNHGGSAQAAAGTYNLPGLRFDGDFNSKARQHMPEYGLDPNNPEDQARFKNMLQEWYDHPSEVRTGPWSPNSPGGGDEAYFIRSGNDVMVLRPNGQPWTYLKGGAEVGGADWNAQWGRAIPMEPMVVPEVAPEMPDEPLGGE